MSGDGLETVHRACPYCGEPIDLTVDLSVPRQDYVEDCAVCCQPIEVGVEVGGAGEVGVTLRRDDE